MKKLLFVLMVMFSASIVSAENKKLEARPVLFLDSYTFYEQCSNTRYPWQSPGKDGEYRVLELQEAAVKMYRQSEQHTREFNALHNSLKTANEAEKVKIYSKLDALSKANNENTHGKEFGDTRDKMCKRITELSEKYAREMGACGVVNYIGQLIYFIDPAYDITSRVLEQINKEYLERKSSQPATQNCVCNCHKS